MDFEFNPENFVAGLLAGWASAFAVYQARGLLSAIRSSVTERAETAQKYATRTDEGRYLGSLRKFWETQHMVGGHVDFAKMLVEPRFIPAPELAKPPDDDVVHTVFHVVPQIHDMPYLYAPYNIETASIEELGKGDRAIALLGLPGSGRTTALMAIAMWSLSEIDFKPPRDAVQERLDAEEAALTNEKRAERIKERLVIEDRARERLALEQGQGEGMTDPGLRGAAGKKGVAPLLRRLLPVYIHLGNLEFSEKEYRSGIDPAEPFVRAMQHHVGPVTAKTFPRKLYDRLNKGQILVLIDGLDDLPAHEQEHKLCWLEAFVKEYRRNFFIVAGAPNGYGKMMRAGLTPVFLRPWYDLDVKDAAKRWAENWTDIVGKRRRDVTKPGEELIASVLENSRGLSVLDVCLKLRAVYSGELEPDSLPGAWMRTYLTSAGLTDDMLPKAIQAAVMQLDEGYITAQRMYELAIGQPAPKLNETDAAKVFKALSGEDDDEIDSLFETSSETEDVVVEDVPVKPEKTGTSPTGLTKKELGRIAKEQTKFIDSLMKMGLLTRFRDGRYQFRFPLITAYLASLSLQTADADIISARATHPTWDLALAYATGHTAVEEAVKTRLEAPPDVLYSNVTSVARWLAYTHENVAWRPSLLKQLGNMFIAPNQYSLIRERVAAALVGAKDRSVLVVFQRALKNSDPDLRRLSCLCLGVMKEESAINVLARLMEDPDNNVQLSAALALGAIGTEPALEQMVVALTSGSEPLRQVVAEAFAAIPEEGYPVLYDAITDEDMMLRRAAVFGLRRVPAPWALISIYRAFLEDQQWYVRSAAQEAFLGIQETENNSLKAYPQPEAIPWLREWIAKQGEHAAPTAEEAMIQALTDNSPLMQAVSALAIGQLGIVTAIGPLYQTLRNREELVRDAAHRAIANLQAHIGKPLPAPA